MNEVFISWSMILPLFIIERAFVALIGIGMFIHFMCMAAAAPVKSPHIVMVFLMAIMFSALGMLACSILGYIEPMFTLLISGVGSMLLFWLWLWYEGMHVKDFLEKKYQ